MDEGVSSIGVTRVREQNNLVSDEAEIESLASELANDYNNILTVDTSQEVRRLEDTIEESLTHLEELSATLETYRQSSDELVDVAVELHRGFGNINKLFNQIDSLEQYLFEANKVMNELESVMNRLDSCNKFKSNKLQMIIDLLPRLSRFSIFDNRARLDESRSSLDGDGTDSSVAVIEEALRDIPHIRSSIKLSTENLDYRLKGNHSEADLTQQPRPVMMEFESRGQVDGSWQELL